jgi:peptidoglycan/xylan/chitin deacetylase (PgdA/CDA1 family)
LGVANTFKQTIKAGLVRSRFLRMVARAVPAQIAILKYHSVQDEPHRYLNSLGPGIVNSTSNFRLHMEIIARQFDPVSMDDVLLFLKGRKLLPRRPIVVTFDDGFADNIEIAAPIMDRLGIPGAFYITVDPVERRAVPWFCRLRHAFGTTPRPTWLDSHDGRTRQLGDPSDRKAAFLAASERCARRRGEAQEAALRTIEEGLEVQPLSAQLMMTWDQVRALRRSGHVVGSHTVTHPNLACLNAEDLQIECVESKTKLEAELGIKVDHFSYPSPILQPHWTPQTVECTLNAGYQCAVTSSSGSVQAGQHPLSLQRVIISEDAEQFVWILENTMLGRTLT